MLVMAIHPARNRKKLRNFARHLIEIDLRFSFQSNRHIDVGYRVSSPESYSFLKWEKLSDGDIRGKRAVAVLEPLERNPLTDFFRGPLVEIRHEYLKSGLRSHASVSID